MLVSLRAMSFSRDELAISIKGVPATAFAGAPEEVRVSWVALVASCVEKPKSKHDALLYASIARLMSEKV